MKGDVCNGRRNRSCPTLLCFIFVKTAKNVKWKLSPFILFILRNTMTKFLVISLFFCFQLFFEFSINEASPLLSGKFRMRLCGPRLIQMIRTLCFNEETGDFCYKDVTDENRPPRGSAKLCFYESTIKILWFYSNFHVSTKPAAKTHAVILIWASTVAPRPSKRQSQIDVVFL